MISMKLHSRPNAAALSASTEFLNSWLTGDRVFIGSHYPEHPDYYGAIIRQRVVAGRVDTAGDGAESWEIFVEVWSSDGETQDGYSIAHDICLDLQTGYLNAVSIKTFTAEGIPGMWWIRSANRRAWTDMVSRPSEVHEYGMTLVLDLLIHNQEE